MEDGALAGSALLTPIEDHLSVGPLCASDVPRAEIF